MRRTSPAMHVAYERIPRPDWASTTTVAIPEGAAEWAGPERWARAIFDTKALPRWVVGLFVLRRGVVKVLGIAPGEPSMLAVGPVIDGEAVIDTDDRHLRFVATTWLSPGLVHVTTAVQLKGRRGWVYFVPVRFLHDPVTRAMMRAAARRLAAGPWPN
jgi:Protein of unknown function (DUF2867)